EQRAHRLGGAQREQCDPQFRPRLAVALRPRNDRLRPRRPVVLRDLQAPAQPAHRLAHGARGRGVLLARLRGREAAVRPVREPLRDPGPRRVGCERRRPLSVPPVGVLHGLPVPAGRGGGGDLRSDPDATFPARAARLEAGWGGRHVGGATPSSLPQPPPNPPPPPPTPPSSCLRPPGPPPPPAPRGPSRPWI